MVELASKPGCVQCVATETDMKKKGVSFVKIDLRDPDVLQRALDAGHQQAPVVFTPTESFSGFQPDRITALASVIG